MNSNMHKGYLTLRDMIKMYGIKGMEPVIPDAFYKMAHGYRGLYLKSKYLPNECSITEDTEETTEEEMVNLARSALERMQTNYDGCKIRKIKKDRKRKKGYWL